MHAVKTPFHNDGKYARDYAANTIKQPAASAIYFGVDYDAPEDEIKNNVLPYFEGVGMALHEQNGLPVYDIGVYGSWVTCDRLAKAGLVKFTWLAQSTGWGGSEDYKKYVRSRKWILKQAFPHGDICGLDYDPNEVNNNMPFGQFLIPLA
jgi:glycoside hydrolase-like protein